MAEYVFTAAAGVRFMSEGIVFERAPELDTPGGQKRYRFATSDAKVAARLRKLDDFGIAEVKEAKNVGAGDS
jgi:hypothetical protein